jgi:hypothetical protein
VKVSVQQALKQFRHLRPVDAGQLRGICLRSRWHKPITAGDLPPDWAEALVAAVDAHRTGVITATTPVYVVFSGATPVAWVNAHARVVTPPVGATGTAARHQKLAVDALCNLHRWVLRDLADARDIRDHNGSLAAVEHGDAIGIIRVAPQNDPTRTTWVRVGADYHATAAYAGQVVYKLGPLPLRIISAKGYGAYGKQAAQLDLRVLCAAHTITDTHPEVGLVTIGNWLAADPSGTHRRPAQPPLYEAVPADELPALFTACYRGRYRTRRAYLEQHLRDNGWIHGLEKLGIDPNYLELTRLEHELFNRTVYAVDAAPPGGIAVFTRQPTTRTATEGNRA